MYLHLGKEVVVKIDDIVGIFDLEKSSISKNTKDFLYNATKKNIVETVSYEMPKSFIVCKDNKRKWIGLKNDNDSLGKVYISQISCATLQKRISR